MTRLLVRRGLAPCLAAALASAAVAAPPPTLEPAALRPGQKAVVRTVFEGSRVEEFEAEIVGVLKGGRAEGDLILGRATSERVVKSGVAQGMSGSPVYVDGKLVGALSSGWPFSREPIFGITPIGEMLEVLGHPAPTTSDETAGPSGLDAGAARGLGARFGAFHWDDPVEPAAAPAPAAEAAAAALRPGALPLPLSCAGLHPGAFESARSMFGPLGFSAVQGGQAAGGGPGAEALEPGSAVAVDLMRGDLQIAAIGTVTYRDGDRVLLFGHPFFQTGSVRLPMATAEITTVIASDLFSFKLGARGRSAGVVTQDRRAALGGTLGGAARMLPVRVSVSRPGGPRQSFRFESIEDRVLAPNLVGLATLNSLLESGGLGANQTVRWTLRLDRAGMPPLVLTDVEAGETPAQETASGVASPLAFLLNNPYGRLTLDSVAVDVQVAPGRELWTLRSAGLQRAVVRPGGSVLVRCELERWRGGRLAREFRVAIPEELPPGRYTLWLGGGPELSRYEAQHLPGRYRPVSLDDAWRRIAGARPSDGLYVALTARAPEVTVEGRDYPELPVSALAVLSSEQSAGDRSRRGDLAKLHEERHPFDGLVRGELQLAVQVDAQAP